MAEIMGENAFNSQLFALLLGIMGGFPVLGQFCRN
jgi:hypothetical protein